MDRQEHILKCEQLYQAPKMILGSLRWQTRSYGASLEGIVLLVPSSGEDLRLRGTYMPKTQYPIRIGLYYKGKYPIRILDIHDGHHNPNGVAVGRAHKHQPTVEHIEKSREAYAVPQLDGVQDPNEALLEFLSESNITSPDSYEPLLL